MDGVWQHRDTMVLLPSESNRLGFQLHLLLKPGLNQTHWNTVTGIHPNAERPLLTHCVHRLPAYTPFRERLDCAPSVFAAK